MARTTSSSRWQVILWLAACLAVPAVVHAQQPPPGARQPHIGYVYPAGGRQGTSFEITIGGQFLDDAAEVMVSGEGAQTTIVKHTKPLDPKQINQLRETLQRAREHLEKGENQGQRPGRRGRVQAVMKLAQQMGADPEQLKAFGEFREQRMDPKRQPNPQLAETLTVNVQLAPDAEPGERELRLLTSSGLTSPLRFHVGRFREYSESEPNDKAAGTPIPDPLPLVLNGQITPGDVDRFSFKARQGQRVVVAASARQLIPYLADAVPGWFQATLALYDAIGEEVAYADDYRFQPDPVLCYLIPKTGPYTLEIKDAIYRGREDFVYRVTLGEIPFVTSMFPLGGRQGITTVVELEGWNLPARRLTLDSEGWPPGIHTISLFDSWPALNRVWFAVDTLPDCIEQEPNDTSQDAQQIEPPLVVNGRIDRPGDWDVFRFQGRAEGQVVAEIEARRLGSPLDSILKLTDADGRLLVANDDHEDKASGLSTHHADSLLVATLPETGTYCLYVGDVQHKGSAAHGYRLLITARRPDFELRVVPATVSARPGTSVPIAVYALRKDGFSDSITLALKDAPPGFVLAGGQVPAGQDQATLTLTVPRVGRDQPFTLGLEGRATIRGREVRRAAVPAEDVMQAFSYHHLVPTDQWLVAVSERGRPMPPLKIVSRQPVKLTPGRTATVRVAIPRWLPTDQFKFVLSQPPDGITIEKVSPIDEGAAIVLRADAEKLKPGLTGNLIIDVFMERAAQDSSAEKPGRRRSIPLGALPAIPYEVLSANTPVSSVSVAPAQPQVPP